jgi:hypothetical protein
MPAKNTFYLGYRGGSGGFIFLHFLLLSDKYRTCFNGNYNFKDIVKKQWNISNLSNWKSTEVWPDNNSTILDDNHKDKLLYFCNPSKDEFFNFGPFTNFNFKKCYYDVKDPSWPDIDSFDDFLKLPKQIQDEVINIHKVINISKFIKPPDCQKTYIWLYTDIHAQHEFAWLKKAYFYAGQPNKDKITNFEKYGKLWNKALIDSAAIYFLENSNIQIKLQDWVNEPDILVDHCLIDKVNQDQYNLLNHWKKLHPPELLQKVGIK